MGVPIYVEESVHVWDLHYFGLQNALPDLFVKLCGCLRLFYRSPDIDRLAASKLF